MPRERAGSSVLKDPGSPNRGALCAPPGAVSQDRLPTFDEEAEARGVRDCRPASAPGC